MRNLDNKSHLNGFTIRAGNGNGIGGKYGGGGLFIDGNSKRIDSFDASPVIEHCKFENNKSPQGGAICGSGNGDGNTISPTIIHCIFISNTATRTNGGAIAISGNRGCDSKIKYYDCVFKGNEANLSGGAVYTDMSDGKFVSEFINCEFIGNVAEEGGAICNINNKQVKEGGNSKIKNCSFSGNKALFDYGGAIMHTSPIAVTVSKCIFFGNSGVLDSRSSGISIDSSLVQGSRTDVFLKNISVFNKIGKAVVDEDPFFENQPKIGLGTDGDLNLKDSSNLNIANMGYYEHGWNKDIHWSYHDHRLDGPNHWNSLCLPSLNMCDSARQSPINIITAPTPPRNNGESLYETFSKMDTKVINKGHTLEFESDKKTFMVLTTNRKNDTFKLVQFHFHTPSEHQINGKPYPMEIHFVHINAKGKIAVLGVLVDTTGAVPNSTLNKFVENLPSTESRECDSESFFSIDDLLPSSKVRNLYSYEGSLTTPPCTEVVKWFVLKNPIKASASQITQFEKREHINSRATKPLNGRTVYSGELISKQN